MDVLRRTRTTRPQVKVVVVTAHGTIDSAVEAMRLGAADFLQKPFSAEEIAEVAARVLLPGPGDANPENYARCLSEAREAILRHELPAAEAAVRKAIGIDPTKPEAFNLLGVTAHLSGRRYPAQNYFRAALALDGSYRSSHRNLERSVDGGVRGVHMEMDLGDDDGKDH
jgi:DNA-binding response OmpR family regulator